MVSRIRWNTLFYFLSFFIRFLTNFLLFVGIARFYGPEVFGQFTAAHTLSTLFILFADFGFDTLLTTEIPRQRERAAALTQQFLSIKLLFCGAATLVMFVVPFFQGASPQTRVLIEIFSFYVLFSALNNFFFALFRGFEQMKHETKISFIINVLLLILLAVFVALRLPILFVALAFVFSRLLGLGLAYRVAESEMEIHAFRLSFTEWRRIWGLVAVFGVTFIFGNLFFMLDTVLLTYIRGDVEVGIYQSVFKIVALVLIVPDILTTTLMPVLSRLHAEDQDRWDRLGMLLNKTLLFVGLAVSTLLFIYADQIIHLLYGYERFEDAIPILRTFSVIVLIKYSVETSALMLTTSDRQRTRMMVVITATVVNLACNLYVLPRFGASGAAFVSLATNVVVGFGYIFAKRARFFVWVRQLKTIVPPVVILGVAAVLWQIRAIPMWYVAPGVVGVFFAVIYYLGYTSDERHLVFVGARPLR
jgi:O-antigen/teichoic acid export membrane protein